jgi:hypothetical protein
MLLEFCNFFPKFLITNPYVFSYGFWCALYLQISFRTPIVIILLFINKWLKTSFNKLWIPDKEKAVRQYVIACVEWVMSFVRRNGRIYYSWMASHQNVILSVIDRHFLKPNVYHKVHIEMVWPDLQIAMEPIVT